MQPLEDRRYTVTEYLSWPDEERWELIDGEPRAMTPTPTATHQKAVGNLAFALQEHRRKGGRGSCKVYLSPIDVILSPDTVVQPDVVVVCDPANVRERIEGAPDLVIEVISPSTAARDRWVKRLLYERHGVPTYLIVDPIECYAELYTLGPQGAYGPSRILAPDAPLELTGMNLGELGSVLEWQAEGAG